MEDWVHFFRTIKFNANFRFRKKNDKVLEILFLKLVFKSSFKQFF